MPQSQSQSSKSQSLVRPELSEPREEEQEGKKPRTETAMQPPIQQGIKRGAEEGGVEEMPGKSRHQGEPVTDHGTKRGADGEASNPGERPDKYRSIDELDNGSIWKQPGQRIKRKAIKAEELVWKSIGSGTMAKTFIDAEKLPVTTKGGPPMREVHRRIVWSLSSGKVIDDCVIDEVPDEILYRRLQCKDTFGWSS